MKIITNNAFICGALNENEVLEEFKPLTGEIEYDGEDPTDREIDQMILEKLESE